MADDRSEGQSSDQALDAPRANSISRKRKRTAHACDVCRNRKTRCDGRTPRCTTCKNGNLECTYAMEAVAKGKSDLILATVLRMERFLEHMDSKISMTPDISALRATSGDTSSPMAPYSMSSGQKDNVEDPFHNWHQNLQNASLSRLHTSSTESILDWPHFDSYAEIRHRQNVSIFHLEQARPLMSANYQTPMLPFADASEIDNIVEAFQQNINFWYPTMAQSIMEPLKAKLLMGQLGNDCDSCLALLLMALGCACEAMTSAFQDDSDPAKPESQSQRRRMGDMYFDCAMSRMHIAYQEVSRSALHCLLFSAFYYAFSQRPLQAWSSINATATKCRVLLSYKPVGTTPDDEECTRRIFWSCFILESDYLAELSALPLSGIADMESSVPLPGQCHTHNNIGEEEQSALYFLACLSIRRLLNRVHHLLYSKDTGVSLDDRRFPDMVAELDHQLEEWRELLPPAFQFALDTQPAPNQQAGFLRQRYLTCRSVIYRPYLMWMLAAPRWVDQAVRDKCKKCLDACIEHILNLRSFSHTVFVDTWICSLSMAAAMMILLAGYRVPGVKPYIRPEATMLGQHLRSLLTRWAAIPGGGDNSGSGTRSPSVAQAMAWIEIADALIQNEASKA